MQPRPGAVRDDLTCPHLVLRCRNAVEAPPGQEVAHGDSGALSRSETARIPSLEAGPEHVRVATLGLEHDPVLVRLGVIEIPPSNSGVIPRLSDLAQGKPCAGGPYARLRLLDKLIPLRDALVSPFVVVPPSLARPVLVGNVRVILLPE